MTTDSYDYFLRARAIYAAPGLGTIQGFDRPLFCWWLPMIASWISLHLSVAQLVVFNNLSAFAMLLVGVILINRGRRNALLAIALAIFLILSIAPEALLSLPHSLMGDFYLSGYILMTEGLVQHWERSKGKERRIAAMIGAALALGLQTKPIFLFWMAPRLVFFLVCRIVAKKALDWKALVILAVSGLSAGYLFFPRNLLSFMHLQYLHNEILRIHQITAAKDWFFSIWREVVFSEKLTTKIAWTLLGVSLTISAFLRLGTWHGERRHQKAWVVMTKAFKSVGKDSGLLTVLFCVAYLTFFVVGKDFRTTQFLFVLGIVWVANRFASSIANRRIASLSAIASAIALVVMGVQFIRVGIPFMSFERLGYDRIAQEISADAKAHGKKTGFVKGAFVSQFSVELNDSALAAYQDSKCGLPSDTSSCHTQVEIHPHSAPFPNGGWGWAGGFPREFFTDDYVLVFSNAAEWNQGLYNAWISERLRRGDPDFLSGLEKVSTIQIAQNRAWIVYRRVETVSRDAFRRIIEQALNLSPDNVWNEPWRVALERMKNPKFDLHSDSEKRRKQKLLMESTSDLQVTDWGKEVSRLIRDSSYQFEELQYPQIARYSQASPKYDL